MKFNFIVLRTKCILSWELWEKNLETKTSVEKPKKYFAMKMDDKKLFGELDSY